MVDPNWSSPKVPLAVFLVCIRSYKSLNESRLTYGDPGSPLDVHGYFAHSRRLPHQHSCQIRAQNLARRCFNNASMAHGSRRN
jgi:hypothetical protein